MTLGLALLRCGGNKNANAPTNPDTEMAPAERPPTPSEPLDAGGARRFQRPALRPVPGDHEAPAAGM